MPPFRAFVQNHAPCAGRLSSPRAIQPGFSRTFYLSIIGKSTRFIKRGPQVRGFLRKRKVLRGSTSRSCLLQAMTTSNTVGERLIPWKINPVGINTLIVKPRKHNSAL